MLVSSLYSPCTGCNLKTMELPDCVLIGVCAVIRSNTVDLFEDANVGKLLVFSLHCQNSKDVKEEPQSHNIAYQ